MFINKLLLAGGLFLAVAGAAAGGANAVKPSATFGESNIGPAFIQTVGESGDGVDKYIEYVNEVNRINEEYAARAAELGITEKVELAAAAEKVLPPEFEILMTDLSFVSSRHDALIRAGKQVPSALYDDAEITLGKIKNLLNSNKKAVKSEAEKVRIKFDAGREALSIELNYVLQELRVEYGLYGG